MSPGFIVLISGKLELLEEVGAEVLLLFVTGTGFPVRA
jgi:hypothetical protein